MGNLMATTAKVRGLAGAVIDGAARDVEEVTEIGFPIFSRAISPATSITAPARPRTFAVVAMRLPMPAISRPSSSTYPNYTLEILDEAEPGSVLVYVLEDGLEIAGMRNLMATTAKVRGLAGAVRSEEHTSELQSL